MLASHATRQVRRLRLRAPDETIARRGVRLLEDALRTASLPDAGARMLLVRRIALGRFDADVAPQTLSLAIERCIAALGSSAVHAAAPDAAQADAVWFRDALEAHTLLALRIAENVPAPEWFWPLAVPEFAAAATRPARLRAVLRALSRRPEASVALPLLAAAVVQRGHAHLLDQAVGAVSAAALRETQAGTPADTSASETAFAVFPDAPGASPDQDREPTAPPRAVSGGVVPAADTGTEQSAILAMPATRPREIAAATRSETIPPQPMRQPVAAEMTRMGPVPHPSVTAAPDAPAATDGGAAPALPAGPRRAQSARARRVGADASPQPDRNSRPVAAASSLSGPHAPTHDESVAHPRPARVALPRGSPQSAPESETHAESVRAPPIGAMPASRTIRQPRWPSGAPTAAGGLMFLLPVLARLGYARWLEGAPEWVPLRIDRRMLALICGRLDLPADDPAWHFAMTPTMPPPHRFGAPALWLDGIADCDAALRRTGDRRGARVFDATGRLLLAAWRGGRRPAAFAPLLRGRRIVRADAMRAHGDLAADVAEAWLTACRRWLRRHAAIGVATLVARPARLTLTPTHADVFFELSDVDLRVRRAGLDFDPGWVPWFGRVVGFQFGRAPWT